MTDISRRRLITGGGGLLTSCVVGFLAGREAKAGADTQPRTNPQTDTDTSSADSQFSLSNSGTVVGDWIVESAPFIRVTDQIGVSTATPGSSQQLTDDDFRTIEATGGQSFIILYAAAYHRERGADQTAPASDWALDVWVPPAQLSPRIVDQPEIAWYRVRGDDGYRYLPTYPRNPFNGGYLCFEGEVGSTIELLFRPDSSEMTLSLPKSAARWKFTRGGGQP